MNKFVNMRVNVQIYIHINICVFMNTWVYVCLWNSMCTRSCRLYDMLGLCSQKQVSRVWISNYMIQNIIRCSYLSML